MDKIETDCIWVILKKGGPTFFKFVANRLDNADDFMVVKKFLITIFEF